MKTMILVTLAVSAAFLHSAGAIGKSFDLEGTTYSPDQNISEGLKDGTLSKEQAAQFRNDELKISVDEGSLRQKHGGALTSGDQKFLAKKVSVLMEHIAAVRNMKADNTGQNFGDGRIGVKTPQAQSESQADLNVIGAIRRRLVNNHSLSGNAKNVKVICIRGDVTLRGAVKNTIEKEKVGATARECSGVSRVDNKLEVLQ